jgi:hypothetical protein
MPRSTLRRRARLGSHLLHAGVIAGGAGVLLVVLGSTAFAGPAVVQVLSACVAPAAGPGEIAKSIETTLGCDVADGVALSPAAGWMTVHMPAGMSSASALDVFEANVKGGDHPYWAGSYAVSFPIVVGGTAGGATYDVSATSARYPDPPAMAHPLSFTSTVPGGTVTAQYSVAFTGSAPAPAADMASMTNNLFVWFGEGSPSTQVRTVSVKPFVPSTPTPTPTPAPTPTPTPTPTPSPTPTATVQATATATPGGGVLGESITVPNTGGGPGPATGPGLALLLAGAALAGLGAALRRRQA